MLHILEAIRDGNIMHYRSTKLIAATCFSCLLLWFGLSLNRAISPQPSPVKIPAAQSPNPNDEQPAYTPAPGQLMGHDGIVNITSPQIQMAKVRLTVSQSDMPPLPLMQSLDIKLPASREITITDDPLDPATAQPKEASTNLKIPRIPHTQPDASAFIFGLATTYERLEASLDTIAYWASHSNAKIIGSMQPSLDLDAPDRVLKKAQLLSVPLGTVESGLEFLDRYFTLLKVLYENRTPHNKMVRLHRRRHILPLPVQPRLHIPKIRPQFTMVHRRTNRRLQPNGNMGVHGLRRRRHLPLPQPCRNPPTILP